MCLLCETGSLAYLLAPLIGLGGAMAIIKLEDKLRRLWPGRGGRACKTCDVKRRKP